MSKSLKKQKENDNLLMKGKTVLQLDKLLISIVKYIRL